MLIMLSSVPRSVVFRASRTAEQRLTFLSTLHFRTRKQHRLLNMSAIAQIIDTNFDDLPVDRKSCQLLGPTALVCGDSLAA